MRIARRLAFMALVLALVAAACGDGGPTAESLPPVSTAPGDETPNLAGACLEGEPDCVDTPVGDEPLDLPNDQNGDGAGLVVDGGLTVADALASSAEGPLAVVGFIVQDGSGARLCELLAESMPPQCGGAWVEVSDLSTVDPDELSTAQGVTWTDQPVTILGAITDGVLVVDPFSA